MNGATIGGYARGDGMKMKCTEMEMRMGKKWSIWLENRVRIKVVQKSRSKTLRVCNISWFDCVMLFSILTSLDSFNPLHFISLHFYLSPFSFPSQYISFSSHHLLHTPQLLPHSFVGWSAFLSPIFICIPFSFPLSFHHISNILVKWWMIYLPAFQENSGWSTSISMLSSMIWDLSTHYNTSSIVLIKITLSGF